MTRRRSELGNGPHRGDKRRDDVSKLNDLRELGIDELNTVSGGDLLNMAIDAAAKAIAGLGQRVVGAAHTPIVPPISLRF